MEKIGDDILSNNDLDLVISSIRGLGEETVNILKKNFLLKPLIRAELINKVISDIKLEEDINEKIVNNICQTQNLKTKTDFDNWLSKQETTEEEFISAIKKNYKITDFCKQCLIQKAKKRYLKRKDDLDMVSYSLIRVNSQSTANELYLRISENESTFEEIASDFSEGPEKNTRGNIGPVSMSKANPGLKVFLSGATIKLVNPPLKLGQWWTIVRLNSLEPAILDQNMELMMARETFDELVEKNLHSLTKKFYS